jgi:hypothetical protein
MARPPPPPPHEPPLHIVVIGYARPESMARLVRSLLGAEYPPSANMSVAFALDGTGNSTLDGELDAVIRLLAEWPFGPVALRRRDLRAGLRDNVLGAWRPPSDTSPPALLLEDDVELSPLWYHWTQACLQRYLPRERGLPPGLLGVSLYTPDDMNEAYVNGYLTDPSTGTRRPACAWQAAHARASSPSSSSAVLFGQPCSWGALYFAAGWRKFLADADRLRSLEPAALPPIPCASDHGAACTHVSANRWGRSSWKRLLSIHMVAHGLFMVYPNMPGRASFSTNHVEPGVHVRDARVLSGQRGRHRVELMTRAWCDRYRINCTHDPASWPLSQAVAFELPPADDVPL